MTRIELVDLQALDRDLGTALRGAVDRVASSAQFILGEAVASFEQALAAHAGVRHAIGVASGSDALVLALRAQGVRPGEVVVTTPLSFIASVEAILRVGALPCFVDVDTDSLCLSPAALQRYLHRCRRVDEVLLDPDSGSRVRAVLPVHLYGRAAAIGEVAAAHGLAVVHDAAQALGVRGQPAAVSFHPSKNLGGWGDGGAVLCDDDAFAATVRSLRIHGHDDAGGFQQVGLNSRLDAIQAAVLQVKLEHLPAHEARRRANAAVLSELLADIPGLVLPPPLSDRDVCHLFTVRHQRRDQLAAALDVAGIATRVYYRRLLSDEPSVRGHLSGGPLDEARLATAEVLSLPVHAYLAPEDLERIAAAVRGAI